MLLQLKSQLMTGSCWGLLLGHKQIFWMLFSVTNESQALQVRLDGLGRSHTQEHVCAESSAQLPWGLCPQGREPGTRFPGGMCTRFLPVASKPARIEGLYLYYSVHFLLLQEPPLPRKVYTHWIYSNEAPALIWDTKVCSTHFFASRKVLYSFDHKYYGN